MKKKYLFYFKNSLCKRQLLVSLGAFIYTMFIVLQFISIINIILKYNYIICKNNLKKKFLKYIRVFDLLFIYVFFFFLIQILLLLFVKDSLKNDLCINFMLSIYYAEIVKFLFISVLIYLLIILIFILSTRTKDKKILIKKNNRNLFVVNNKKKYNFNKNIKRFYANNILKVNNARTNNQTIFGTYKYNYNSKAETKKQTRLDFLSKYSSDSRPKNYEQKIEDLLILLNQNECLKQMFTDNKLKLKNFILQKQCDLVSIANHSDNLQFDNHIMFAEIIQSLNTNLDDWDFSFIFPQDFKNRIDCLNIVSQLGGVLYDDKIEKNALYDLIGMSSYKNELNYISNMLWNNLMHNWCLLEYKNIKLLFPFTNGKKSTDVVFNCELKNNLYQCSGTFMNNALKMRNGNLNRLGLCHLITPQNNNYLFKILNTNDYYIKCNIKDFWDNNVYIKNPYYGKYICNLFNEYNVNTKEEFKLVFVDALKSSNHFTYFNDNILCFSKKIKGEFRDYSAIDNELVKKWLPLNQNNLVNNNLELIATHINIINN